MSNCKHSSLHIEAIVTLHADKPRADGSYVLGVSRELYDATVGRVTCADCDEIIVTYGSGEQSVSVDVWLRAFYLGRNGGYS